MSDDLVLNHRYRLIERLATGGMGEVWQATDEVLERPVAVKLLRPEFVSDEMARTRFRAEARFAAGLQHSGIAQVYDYGEHDDQAYLVMELVPGEPLSKILRRTGSLTPESTLDIIGQAARALQVAHTSGIIHRDVKPANLMITGDGTVKITDFGIARGSRQSNQTLTGMVMGTAQYVAPEQASGQVVTPAADLYSLGIVAYQCLHGEPPFDADSPVAIALKHVREEPPELPLDVPAPVRELVRQLLAKDPAERPASAQALADRAYVIKDSLALGLEPAEPSSAPPVTADTSELPWSEKAGNSSGARSALFVTSMAVGILLLGMIVVGSLWRLPRHANLNGNSTKVQSVPGDVLQGKPAEPGRKTPTPGYSWVRPNPVNGVSTSPTPKASTTGKASATPTKTTPTTPHPTPTPVVSTTPPPTPTSDPSSTPPAGLSSDTRV
ncbi:serine/threonine-protein kinase [Actinomadura scrupuli]|uniref:serine/threonine-protein kinase n=1 Tax=Actinomadura scrupuli TaxID=559629 RepID=UPI003D9838C9